MSHSWNSLATLNLTSGLLFSNFSPGTVGLWVVNKIRHLPFTLESYISFVTFLKLFLFLGTKPLEHMMRFGNQVKEVKSTNVQDQQLGRV
jgi:phosphatidylglycerophosphatase A